MREIIARVICVLTVVVVVALSLWFASVHNRPAPAGSPPPAAMPVAAADRTNAPAGTQPPAPSAPAPAAKAADDGRGPAIFAEQHCATCHSIADIGNPRSPLDGVGDRHGLEELRMWITGTGVATAKLSAAIAKRKQRYQTMPDDDLRALVAYLAGLKAAAR